MGEFKMGDKPDDLDAVRTLVSTLERFEAEQQERIIRWAREKLGLPSDTGAAPQDQTWSGQGHTSQTQPTTHQDGQHSQDIKTFIAAKNPQSDNQFAATVAYFYRFEAPQSKRKDMIAAEDLQDACRMTGRPRLKNPGQTLRNAHGVGLLDKSGDPGAFTINTVGENLVAMTLPSSSGQGTPGKKRPQKNGRKKKRVKKKKKGTTNRAG
jgi:hypothetical protein